MSCKYCGGTGSIVVPSLIIGKDGKEKDFAKGRTCICRVNPSINTKYAVLSGAPDTSPEDMKKVAKLGFKNRIFVGTEARFLYMLKSFIALQFVFNKTFRILDGAQLIKHFHTEMSEGKSIVDVIEYDLFVLLCTAKPPFIPMKEAVYEAVRSRTRVSRATWLYARTLDDLYKSQEFSDDMVDMVKSSEFTVVDSDKFELVKEIAWSKGQTASEQIERKVDDTLGSF